MVEESSAEDIDAGAEQTPAQENKEPADETSARFRALLASSAERWARRIARAGGVEHKDIALIAESLAISPDRAAAWANTIGANQNDERALIASLMTLGKA